MKLSLIGILVDGTVVSNQSGRNVLGTSKAHGENRTRNQPKLVRSLFAASSVLLVQTQCKRGSTHLIVHKNWSEYPITTTPSPRRPIQPLFSCQNRSLLVWNRHPLCYFIHISLVFFVSCPNLQQRTKTGQSGRKPSWNQHPLQNPSPSFLFHHLIKSFKTKWQFILPR